MEANNQLVSNLISTFHLILLLSIFSVELDWLLSYNLLVNVAVKSLGIYVALPPNMYLVISSWQEQSMLTLP